MATDYYVKCIEEDTTLFTKKLNGTSFNTIETEAIQTCAQQKYSTDLKILAGFGLGFVVLITIVCLIVRRRV